MGCFKFCCLLNKITNTRLLSNLTYWLLASTGSIHIFYHWYQRAFGNIHLNHSIRTNGTFSIASFNKICISYLVGSQSYLFEPSAEVMAFYTKCGATYVNLEGSQYLLWYKSTLQSWHLYMYKNMSCQSESDQSSISGIGHISIVWSRPPDLLDVWYLRGSIGKFWEWPHSC